MTYMDNRPLDELRREDAHITAQVITLVASNGTLTTISGVLIRNSSAAVFRKTVWRQPQLRNMSSQLSPR
jgi:hypothetical protein